MTCDSGKNQSYSHNDGTHRPAQQRTHTHQCLGLGGERGGGGGGWRGRWKKRGREENWVYVGSHMMPMKVLTQAEKQVCVFVCVCVPRQAVFSGLGVKPDSHWHWKEPGEFKQRPSAHTPTCTHSSTSAVTCNKHTHTHV